MPATEQVIDGNIQISVLCPEGFKPTKLLLSIVFEIHIGSSA
jgi:hypothetical protein